MSGLKTNNLQLLDDSRTIPINKLAEMNGGFSFRNKIVDGRFDFWYEGMSQTASGYGSDTMWGNANAGSTKVHSQQALVAGVDLPAIDCPSAKYFSRTIVTSVVGSASKVFKYTDIEGVGTLAGKSVTLSFYAKANAVKSIAPELYQYFGSSGSAPISIPLGLLSLSTEWQRFKITTTLPTINGKTIAGGNDFLQVLFWFDAGSDNTSRSSGLGQQSGTFDLACIQLEEGSVMTPFEELPMEVSRRLVNRYYQKIGGESQYDVILQGYGTAGMPASIEISLPTQMRVSPSRSKVGTWYTANCAQPAAIGSSSTQTLAMNSAVTATGVFQFNSVDATTYIALDARL